MIKCTSPRQEDSIDNAIWHMEWNVSYDATGIRNDLVEVIVRQRQLPQPVELGALIGLYNHGCRPERNQSVGGCTCQLYLKTGRSEANRTGRRLNKQIVAKQIGMAEREEKRVENLQQEEKPETNHCDAYAGMRRLNCLNDSFSEALRIICQ